MQIKSRVPNWERDPSGPRQLTGASWRTAPLGAAGAHRSPRPRAGLEVRGGCRGPSRLSPRTEAAVTASTLTLS